MSGEANASEFEAAARKRNYDAARGVQPGFHDRAKPGDAARDYVIGGIMQPEKERLVPGTLIYRLGSFAQDTPAGRRGRWWISRETAELFVERALSVHHFIDIVRQHLAVPEDFNLLTGVFSGRVVRPLLAFGGVGGLVHQDPPTTRGGVRHGARLPGGTELTGTARDRTMKRQLFIPGLPAVPDALDVQPLEEVGKWMRAFEKGAR